MPGSNPQEDPSKLGEGERAIEEDSSTSTTATSLLSCEDWSCTSPMEGEEDIVEDALPSFPSGNAEDGPSRVGESEGFTIPAGSLTVSTTSRNPVGADGSLFSATWKVGG